MGMGMVAPLGPTDIIKKSRIWYKYAMYRNNILWPPDGNFSWPLHTPNFYRNLKNTSLTSQLQAEGRRCYKLSNQHVAVLIKRSRYSGQILTKISDIVGNRLQLVIKLFGINIWSETLYLRVMNVSNFVDRHFATRAVSGNAKNSTLFHSLKRFHFPLQQTIDNDS